MPVIRGTPPQTIAPEKRAALEQRLADEIRGPSSAGGPVIFEVPFGRTGKLDVLVVWEEWEGVRSEDRSDVILDVYRQLRQDDKIAQALGVTFLEAADQQLLPYEIISTGRATADPDAVRTAMIEAGAFVRPNGKPFLRLPTRDIAEAVLGNLQEKLPTANWAVQPR